MPDRFFGEIPQAPQATTWPTRQALSEAGIHRPTMGGISGTKVAGADSIVVSGGYEDDQDLGDEIIYTGAGGNDPGTGKQIAHQELDQFGNAGLVTSQLEGLPVRVIRDRRSRRHQFRDHCRPAVVVAEPANSRWVVRSQGVRHAQAERRSPGELFKLRACRS